MKKVLVTGATGFAGSHALEALSQDRSIEVVASCRNKSRLPQGFKGVVKIGDIRQGAYLATLFEGVDTVCNCFAWTSLYNHASESNELFLKPTLRLIDLAIKSGVKRFINVSTTSAASPETSADSMAQGIPRSYWPHLCNVITIENHLREKVNSGFTVINLRLGLFAGNRYALGLLPILLPRLRTHLVPWVAGGRTSMPIIDGRDIGQAFHKAVLAEGMTGYQSFNIVGPSVPSAREVIELFHENGYPKPHFSVPFPIAFAFGWLMEIIAPIVPWEPLVTRSIIHLLREVNADNQRAEKLLGYIPTHGWQEAVRAQLTEMTQRHEKPMSLARPTA
ncbi:MAG: NAD-dependent epimerase/dehydratase family protein [Thermodesulfobacteriota bacterium]